MKKIADIDIAQVELIDRDAAAILKSAVKTTKEILKRRDDLDRQGKQDQTLYVMAGEFHDRPAHQLHHLLVLQGLREADEKVVTGIERAGNSVDDRFIQDYLLNIAKVDPKDVPKQAQLYKNDPFFRGVVDMVYSLHEPIIYANYSSYTLNFNLLRMHAQSNKDFMALRTDAARVGNDYLDVSDPVTANIMQKSVNKVKRNMKLVSQEGMYVRNVHMAKRLHDVARAYKARIAVQLCGQAHVNGDHASSHQKEGLCEIFKNSSEPVIGVFLGPRVDSGQGLKPHEVIECKGLPELSAKYNPTTDKKAKPKDSSFWGGLKSLFNSAADIQSEQEEMIYVNEKLNSMGLGHLIVGKP